MQRSIGRLPSMLAWTQVETSRQNKTTIIAKAPTTPSAWWARPQWGEVVLSEEQIKLSLGSINARKAAPSRRHGNSAKVRKMLSTGLKAVQAELSIPHYIQAHCPIVKLSENR